LSQHNLDIIDEFFDPDFIENQFGIKPYIPGMKERFESLYWAFADYHLVNDNLVAERDRVWLRMI
jgi:hypothetical protein